MTNDHQDRLMELSRQINEIMLAHNLSHTETGIDNFTYSDKPASVTYHHFQLRAPIVHNYRAAADYLEGQLRKARELVNKQVSQMIEIHDDRQASQ